DFVVGFTYDMKFENACVFSEGESESGVIISPPPIEELKLTLNKEIYLSNGGDDVVLTVQAFDASDKPVDVNNDEVVTLNINQNSDKPIVNIMDSDQKTLTSGIAVFNLRTTENPGNAALSVSGSSGVSSNSVEVKSSAKEIKLYPFVYYEIEGFDELQAALKAEEEKAKEGSGEDAFATDDSSAGVSSGSSGGAAGGGESSGSGGGSEVSTGASGATGVSGDGVTVDSDGGSGAGVSDGGGSGAGSGVGNTAGNGVSAGSGGSSGLGSGFANDLENILSNIKAEQDSQSGGSVSGEETATDKADEKNIKMLKFTLVE
ncbi:hypothetical protein A3B60_00425, partial [Candidatus Peregrinibacteria bacterium RIFCSPLOWO2_01_FULL_39_12]